MTTKAMRKEEQQEQQEEETQRRNVMRAWLAPLLVGSATGPEAQTVAREAAGAMAGVCVRAEPAASPKPLQSLALRSRLAQGFKYAANRRREHPHAREDARAYLAEQAKEMLGACNFWFTKITLLHALTLWHLADRGSGRRDHDARS